MRNETTAPVIAIRVNNVYCHAVALGPDLYDVRPASAEAPFTLQRDGDNWLMLRHTDRAQWQTVKTMKGL